MDNVTTRIDGRIATVTFSRGDGLNTLSLQLMEELRDTARLLADNPDLNAVVLQGEKVFSAGVSGIGVANALAATAGHMDRDQFQFAMETEDFTEAVTAYLQKRKPNFIGN